MIKLECQAQGCDQAGKAIRMRSNWDVKHQEVAKQKRTRHWNPGCRRRYPNCCIISILSNSVEGLDVLQEVKCKPCIEWKYWDEAALRKKSINVLQDVYEGQRPNR